MKNTNYKKTLKVLPLFVAFVLWTIAIRYCDVQAIGPENSSVGFAHLNGFFHNVTGEHMLLYTITDWLGLIPLCTVLYFGFLGFLQLCKRKSLKNIARLISGVHWLTDIIGGILLSAALVMLYHVISSQKTKRFRRTHLVFEAAMLILLLL